MKIVINYDLIEEIKNVNQAFGPFKIVRNNKWKWMKFHLPFYTIINYTFQKDLWRTFIILVMQFDFLVLSELIGHSINKEDIYKEEAEERLYQLLPYLRKMELDVDYESLLNTVLYYSTYSVHLQDDKIPQLIQLKYLLLSTKNNDKLHPLFLLQEHVIGSKVYTLSINNSVKKHQFVYSKA